MYDYLKSYIEPGGNSNNHFYPVSENEILESEIRMKIKFPQQLKDFYNEVGFGFLSSDKFFINRIMSPTDIADFMCNEEPYDCIDRSVYEENEMVFMHLSGEDFLTISYDSDNAGSILYFWKKIADSFLEFIKKMYDKPNFFIHGEK